MVETSFVFFFWARVRAGDDSKGGGGKIRDRFFLKEITPERKAQRFVIKVVNTKRLCRKRKRDAAKKNAYYVRGGRSSRTRASTTTVVF